jgi:hypothetical protein
VKVIKYAALWRTVNLDLLLLLLLLLPPPLLLLFYIAYTPFCSVWFRVIVTMRF